MRRRNKRPNPNPSGNALAAIVDKHLNPRAFQGQREYGYLLIWFPLDGERRAKEQFEYRANFDGKHIKTIIDEFGERMPPLGEEPDGG